MSFETLITILLSVDIVGLVVFTTLCTRGLPR